METKEPRALRKANDVFAAGPIAEPTLLFDEFWREGEVALLFGEHGVGKSFLAVEIAEALASGQPIKGLSMPESRRNVLYVDLVLSDGQFGFRYSSEGRKDRWPYQFAAGLHRDSPDEDEELVKWLPHVIERDKIDVVIIDDLSVISRTEDGTQDTLGLIRELRRLSRKFGISALLLADSQPYVQSRQTSERDLRRRRILCAHADSVFALSTTGNCTNICRQLVQTRTQSDDFAWPQASPAHFRFRSRADGFAGYDFIEQPISEEERVMICQIKTFRDRKGVRMPFRDIAEALGISKSKAARLYKKWKPSLEPKVEPKVEPQAAPEPEPDIITEVQEEEAVDIADKERYGFDPDAPNPEPECSPVPAPVPVEAAPRRRSIHDLERGADQNGNPIFIESRREYDGKPQIWYQFNPRSKTYTRWERKAFTISGRNVGKSRYLEGEKLEIVPRGP